MKTTTNEQVLNKEQNKWDNPLIPKEAVALVELISGQNPRKVLDYVLIENNHDGKVKLVATDAHIMGIIEKNAIPSEEYPLDTNNDVKWDTLLLHRDTIKALDKTTPKKKKANFILTQTIGCVDNINGAITIRNTDLQTANVQVQEVADSKYPDYQAILPQGEPVFSINLGLPILEKLVKTMKKLNALEMKFHFFGEERVIKILAETDTAHITVLAMPLRKG